MKEIIQKLETFKEDISYDLYNLDILNDKEKEQYRQQNQALFIAISILKNLGDNGNIPE